MDLGDESGSFGERYALASTWRLTGHIDVRALQAALDDVVARHEILRTVVVRTAESPYQRVEPPCPVMLQVVDLSGEDPARREAVVERFAAEAEAATLNVRDLPLLRAVLGRLDSRDSVLALVTHHSATDAWSMQLIMRDLAVFYAKRTGRQDLPDLPQARQYGEFAIWERNSLDRPASKSAQEYWRNKLRDARIFTLRADRPVKEQTTRPYSAYNFLIDAKLMDAVSRLAGQTQSTLFMVLSAAFYVHAHLATGEDDLVLPTITAGRDEATFHDTVGPFLNFLPIRTRISSCSTFRDVITETKRNCIEAYQNTLSYVHINQAAPDLVRSYEDPCAAPFTFEMVQSQIFPSALPLAENSSEVRRFTESQAVTGDLPKGVLWNMDFLPSGEMMVSILYNLEHFNAQTIEGLALSYLNNLRILASTPDAGWARLGPIGLALVRS